MLFSIACRDIGEGATLKAGTAPLKQPDAYRSSATHFTPIVLSSHEKKTSPARSSTGTSPAKADRTSRNIKELKKQLLKKHNVQEGEAKLSPRQPDTTDQSSPAQNNTPTLVTQTEASTESSRPTIAAKPVSASKPSITQTKDRGGASTPVTQAVRPLPRNSGINQNTHQVSASMENLNNNSNNRPAPAVNNISNSMHNLAHTSSVQVTEPVQTLPTISNAQTNHTTQQPLVVNGATLSTPPMIPSYPSMPVVLQRDPTTGAMSWIPVVHNMPYWPMSPQQAPAPAAVIQPVTAQAPVTATQQQMTPQTGETTPAAPQPAVRQNTQEVRTEPLSQTDIQPPTATTANQTQPVTRPPQNSTQQTVPPKPARERKPKSMSTPPLSCPS